MDTWFVPWTPEQIEQQSEIITRSKEQEKKKDAERSKARLVALNTGSVPTTKTEGWGTLGVVAHLGLPSTATLAAATVIHNLEDYRRMFYKHAYAALLDDLQLDKRTVHKLDQWDVQRYNGLAARHANEVTRVHIGLVWSPRMSAAIDTLVVCRRADLARADAALASAQDAEVKATGINVTLADNIRCIRAHEHRLVVFNIYKYCSSSLNNATKMQGEAETEAAYILEHAKRNELPPPERPVRTFLQVFRFIGGLLGLFAYALLHVVFLGVFGTLVVALVCTILVLGGSPEAAILVPMCCAAFLPIILQYKT